MFVVKKLLPYPQMQKNVNKALNLIFYKRKNMTRTINEINSLTS